MIRRPPRSTPLYSSAASDVYKRQAPELLELVAGVKFLVELAGTALALLLNETLHLALAHDVDDLDFRPEEVRDRPKRKAESLRAVVGRNAAFLVQEATREQFVPDEFGGCEAKQLLLASRIDGWNLGELAWSHQPNAD